MEKDKHVTEVVFRIYKKLMHNDQVIALFPYEVETDYCISSYMRIGQHGLADYQHVVETTKLATKEQYEPLFNELERIGYNLKVIKRRNYDKFLKSRSERLQLYV